MHQESRRSRRVWPVRRERAALVPIDQTPPSTQPQPRESSWRSAPGAPQSVTSLPSSCASWVAVADADFDAVVACARSAGSHAVRTCVSRITGT